MKRLKIHPLHCFISNNVIFGLLIWIFILYPGGQIKADSLTQIRTHNCPILSLLYLHCFECQILTLLTIVKHQRCESWFLAFVSLKWCRFHCHCWWFYDIMSFVPMSQSQNNNHDMKRRRRCSLLDYVQLNSQVVQSMGESLSMSWDFMEFS